MRNRNLRSHRVARFACLLVVASSPTLLAGCGSGASRVSPSTSSATQPSTSTSIPAGTDTSPDSRRSNGAPITRSEAAAIATGRYGGRAVDVEPDTEHGQATWEVEITGSQRGRIEVDVAQDSGRIVAVEED